MVVQVAEYGSVSVDKLMEVERYSHVMHISSTVTGKIKPHLNCWDVLRATLPAGTVSGAPKVRAMQIIDELEVNRRGPYGGGLGYVSFSGEILQKCTYEICTVCELYSYLGYQIHIKGWAVPTIFVHDMTSLQDSHNPQGENSYQILDSIFIPKEYCIGGEQCSLMMQSTIAELYVTGDACQLPFGGQLVIFDLFVFSGGMDIALALRTMVVPTSTMDTILKYNSTSVTRQERLVYIQAGAGLVADSEPDKEYDETVNKAAALGRAIDLAESAFVENDVQILGTKGFTALIYWCW